MLGKKKNSLKLALFPKKLKAKILNNALKDASLVSDHSSITTESADKKTTLHRNHSIQLQSQAYIANLITQDFKQY